MVENESRIKGGRAYRYNRGRAVEESALHKVTRKGELNGDRTDK
jgi:hypothetical protein